MFASVLRFTTLALAFVAPFMFIDGVSAEFKGDRCGTIAPTGVVRDRIEASIRTHRDNHTNTRIGFATLDATIHVISEDDTRQGGNLPDSMIYDQITVLNDNYKDTGLNFRIAGINRITNKGWYRKVYYGTPEANQMTNTLRQGGPAHLNIYTVGFKELPPNAQPLLGYATFPWDLTRNGKLDGVIVLGESLPGGTAAPYNFGKTVTHEVGHWTGLYHTFQAGDGNSFYCDLTDGDYVDDTPVEDGPAYGCQDGRDSCPQSPGLDPIHNFMDYSDDTCLTSFTPGQTQRLRAALTQFRDVAY